MATDTPPKTRKTSRSRTAKTPDALPSDADTNGNGKPGEGETDNAGAGTPPPRPKGTGAPARSPRSGTLQARLEEWLGALALPYAALGDEYAANLIAARAPAIAEAWAELAKQNKAVARVLERLIQGSAWGAVILSSGSLLVPLLAHHGILPLQSDPFAMIYGGSMTIPGNNRNNRSSGMPDWSTTASGSREHDAQYQSPPQREGGIPGTFTVADSNNAAATPPGSE